jgi:transposase
MDGLPTHKTKLVKDYVQSTQGRLMLHVLPGYALELNPDERVWLHLGERLLSHRLLDGYDAILEDCCEAWNALTPKCIRSLIHSPGSSGPLHKVGGIICSR